MRVTILFLSISLVTACTTFKPIKQIDTSNFDVDSVDVVTIPAPVAVSLPVRVEYKQIERDSSFSSSDDYDVPAFSVSGSAIEVCSFLAFKFDYGLFASNQLENDDMHEQQELAGDLTAVDDYVVDFRGGLFSSLLEYLSRIGIRVVVVNNVIVCSDLEDWVFIDDIFMSSEKFSGLFPNIQATGYGGGYLLRGDSVALRNALVVLKSFFDVPIYGSIEVYALPFEIDQSLLLIWLEKAGLSGEFQLFNNNIVASRDVVAAVQRYIDSRNAADCVFVEWRVRSVNISDLLKILDLVVPDVSCRSSGGTGFVNQSDTDNEISLDSEAGEPVGFSDYQSDGGWYLSDPRGLLVNWVAADRLAAVYLALERYDPFPRPVVVTLISVISSQSLRDSLAAVFNSNRVNVAGLSVDSIIDESALLLLRHKSLFLQLEKILARDDSNSLVRLRLSGLVGDKLSVNSGRSVAFVGGAVVGDDGTVREEIKRIKLGVSVSMRVVPVDSGWALSYELSFSGPTSVESSYYEISKSGNLFVPLRQFVMVLSLEESTDLKNQFFLGSRKSQSFDDTYILVRVDPGVLQ